MLGKYLCDTYPFILLFCLIMRVVAEITADYIREEDTFVNRGLRNVTTVSDLQCCVTCMLDDICKSVSYNEADRICQVNDKNPDEDENATTTSSVGWTSFYQKTCRSGWHFYSGSCYQVVAIAQNWTTSESHCQALGGHLVDIQDSDEDRFVMDLVNQTCNGCGYTYWIGLNDIDDEGTFVWSSSAPNQFQRPIPFNDKFLNCVLFHLYWMPDWTSSYCGDNWFCICKADE